MGPRRRPRASVERDEASPNAVILYPNPSSQLMPARRSPRAVRRPTGPVPTARGVVEIRRTTPAVPPASPAPTGPAAPRPSSGSSPNAILVVNLHKTYPDKVDAVRGISFHVREGEFYGIVGPNGAGKSTTIGILGTLIRKTGGEVRVLGFDPATHPNEIRKRIGFAMQEAGVDDLATGLEFLRLQGRLYGLKRSEAAARTDELLKLFELESAARRRIKTYSGGMKRRIDLASALIHRPPLLFLDEPTEGLDPRSRSVLWGTLRRLNKTDKITVVLSTHYMEEADQLCDRLAVIDQGKIVVEGSPTELKASLGGQNLVLAYPREVGPDHLAKAEAALKAEALVKKLQRVDHELVASVQDAASAAPVLLRRLDQARVPPATLEIRQPTLDDVYLRYTGRTLQAAEATKVSG